MTKVKICGITNLEDAMAAADLGADFLGFNFYPKSPRFIPPDRCASIAQILKLKFPATQLVGVFVNSSLEEIEAIFDLCQLNLAQLHGDEPPGMLSALKGKGYKAFRGIPEEIEPFILDENNPPSALLDSKVNGNYGGTGVTGNWRVAHLLAERYPIFLGGGLTAENVALAIRQVSPWGVDTASGVEVEPGKKDLQKMVTFIKAVRESV